MFKSLVFYGLSALILAASPPRAAENCDSYSVVPGDTLRVIAERYYGSRDLSPLIYEANMDMVGENPNSIEIGMSLNIPCREGMRSPQPTAFLALIGSEADMGRAPQFAAKAGDTPFMDGDNTGVIPEILAAALREGGYEGAMDIARPETTSDLLQVSTQPTAMLTFPWVMPQCDAPASLSPQSAYVCENYSFSAPLYEITLGIFTLEGSPLAAAEAPEAFAGTTICVPQFHSDDILRESGIIAANANSTIVPDFQNCLAGLESGRFDAFVADYQSYREIMPEAAGMVDIPAFAQTSTLRAIAYTANPAAMEVLNMTNAGLDKILSSGEWFTIVNQNLSQLTN